MARQAIVIVHGMGEQRPVETLNHFSKVVTRIQGPNGPVSAKFYSRSDRIEGSFEGRRHLIPRQNVVDDEDNVVGSIETQTEIYEYHWAHLMTGNRLDDLWPTFRRMLFPATGVVQSLFVLVAIALGVVGWSWLWGPWEGAVPAAVGAVAVLAGFGVAAGTLLRHVPSGLVVVWFVLWGIIGWVAWALAVGPLAGSGDRSVTAIVGALIGGGAAAAIVSYIASRVLPGWLIASFVDVVRYLDTSPRSLDNRRRIRAGIVDLLNGLHDDDRDVTTTGTGGSEAGRGRGGRYDRIVVVAHSLGSYIAYDAISYLWSQRGHRGSNLTAEEIRPLEEAASSIPPRPTAAKPADVRTFQAAQHATWKAMRATKVPSPWLISDFVSFGSPMYFADRLYTRDTKDFNERVAQSELVTCPPQNERRLDGNVNNTKRFFTYARGQRRVFHEAAPFAIVRWTNLWYPARLGFFGDWFGGPLGPLLGGGIRDVALSEDRPKQLIPGYAHASYLSNPNRRTSRSFAGELDQILGMFRSAPLSSHAAPTDESAGLDSTTTG